MKTRYPKLVSALFLSLFAFVACEKEESTGIDASEVSDELNVASQGSQILTQSLSAILLDGDYLEDSLLGAPLIVGGIEIALDCPVVSLETISEPAPMMAGIHKLTLDYGAVGCAHPIFGNDIKGSISYTFSLLGTSLNVEFKDYQIDAGPVLNGSFMFDITKSPEKIEFSGSVDLDASVGLNTTHLSGLLSGYISIQNSEISISEASMLVTLPDGSKRDFQLKDILIHPLDHENFIPESGSLSFTAPNTRPFGPELINVHVEFLATSPIDGIVMIQVGEASTPVPYQLPWFE